MTTKTATKVHGFVVKQLGGPEQLEYGDIELKPPGAGEALVRSHASGVNFLDVGQRTGIYPREVPFVPGVEGAGVVEQVGEGVTVVKPGDHVAYTGEPGAYAEATVVRAESLIPLPPDFDFIQGAAFPLQGMTAHYLVYEFRDIKPGETVMIHAAAGGMGLLLVQWAKHLGARVIGTVSTEEKAAKAREAGADEIILYSKQDFVAESQRMTNGKGVDLIIDGVGKDTFTKNLDAVAIRGNIVIYGAASGLAEPMVPNVLMGKAATVSGGHLSKFMMTRAELMARSADVIAGIKEGWLKLSTQVLPLEQAAKAHELLENRQTSGKIVLSVGK